VQLGGAVERGTTATRVDLQRDGLLVELRHADGSLETSHPAFVIGAGGAHSVTRDSMHEPLGGATYEGHFLVADIALRAPLPRGQTSIVVGPQGLLLLAPLPQERWISFLDLEETTDHVTAAEVISRVAARLGGRCHPTDVAWLAPFRMHRRIVSRLADGRRFLVGDAAHLSSPFGGEGLNAGLHDAFDLAWKLSLVLQGTARPSLLEDYAVERVIADQHVLAVSDQVHAGIVSIAQAVREGREVSAPATDPLNEALLRNARAMIDIDYAGSPLVADHTDGSAPAGEPHPGQRYPDWSCFGGLSHHLLVFGRVSESGPLEALEQRWSGCLAIHRDPDVRPARAGIPSGGMVLIRPDGHIGFRAPAAHPEAIAALDRHLGVYLI
jgi:hypothetical protein